MENESDKSDRKVGHHYLDKETNATSGRQESPKALVQPPRQRRMYIEIENSMWEPKMPSKREKVGRRGGTWGNKGDAEKNHAAGDKYENKVDSWTLKSALKWAPFQRKTPEWTVSEIRSRISECELRASTQQYPKSKSKKKCRNTETLIWNLVVFLLLL